MNLGQLAKPIATSIATSVAASAIANPPQASAAEMASQSPTPVNSIQSFNRKTADVSPAAKMVAQSPTPTNSIQSFSRKSADVSPAAEMATDLKTTNNIVPFARGKSVASEFAAGITAGKPEAELATAGLAKSVSDYLPRSPAKVGPLSDLDKTGAGLTDEFLSGIDGGRIGSVMNDALNPESKFGGNLGLGNNNSNSSSAAYSPVYNITGTQTDKDFITQLEQHDRQFMDWLARTQDRFSRGRY